MGGRRKSAKKEVKKKRTGLRTVFKCVQCNNDDVVECKMEKQKGTAELRCRVCGASFTTNMNYLTKPIDVYSQWIDECERLNDLAEAVEGDET